MSWWTSLRDSAEASAGAYLSQNIGLNISPALSVGAGGTPTAQSTAAPGGAPDKGAPNSNPAATFVKDNTTLIIVAVVLVGLFLFLKGR